MQNLVLLASVLALPSLALSNEDDRQPQWGGFRGNNGCGHTAATGLPATLDPEENLMWRVEVPSGYSSPTVAGGKLFLTGFDGKTEGMHVTGSVMTMCLDALSGDVLWDRVLEIDGERPGMNSPAAPSPATDGSVVASVFHNLGVVVHDVEGEELWRKPIGPFNIPHGMATSPLVHDGLVVLQVDQDGDAYLVAWDAKTGAERWRADRPGVTHSYATPAIWTPAKGAPQVVVSGSFQIAGYDLAKGDKVWWMDGSAWQSKSIPVFEGGSCYVNAFMPALGDMGFPTFNGEFGERDADGDGFVAKAEFGDPTIHQLWFIFDLDGDELLDADEWEFALSANKAVGGLFAIELGGKGDVTGSKVRWKYDEKRGMSDTTTPVIANGTMFMIAEGGFLTSVDLATGKLVKQDRVGQPDQYFASPVAGDGKLYLASLSGILTVVSAEPEWEQLASHVLEDDKVWATPALAGGSVYVRSERALYCFEQVD